MSSNYLTPGVYREESVLKSTTQLQTGVPGFVGFVKSSPSDLLKEPISLNRQSEFYTLFEGQLAAGSYLGDAVNGFFLNGGARCYVVSAMIADGADEATKESALVEALQTLSPLTDLDLVAIPDAMMLGAEAAKRVQSEMLRHCEANGNRMAILDALPKGNAQVVMGQRHDIMVGLPEPVNGALYYPWLKINGDRWIPPSGHVAGIFSRSDARTGVFKAPANEEVLGTLDLVIQDESGLWKAINIDNRLQGQLNPEGINCLRAFPGRGIRVWGARTLSYDPNWRYINVRRLVLTLRRWIDANMTWASFEPNTPQLWIQLKRELTVYLTELWQAGALAGSSAEQAFFIKCDGETNPPDVREAGQIVTMIGLAPSAPAEFIIVRIVLHTGVEPR
ncbi:MAG TPA: phage tail sheath subtilisin-like domain-containing protein [Pyrinomonadaceae bacterium]|nr:phage tail sheath subtilisin-like domain-containing protein [Pyrinomonadaceae bacterium]